jgi:predicted CopG family antitoxin
MTKVISISDEAYEKLKKLKNERSFSEVILELSIEKNKDSLMKFAGALSDKEAKKIKDKIYNERGITSKRFN